MARARNIKPALFLNEDLVECSFPARYLFTGLWTQADCFGRLENRPKKLKMALLPCDNVDLVELLQELADRDFIHYYGEGKASTDPSQPYIWITGFERHQNPHKKEIDQGSKIPAPPKENPDLDRVQTGSNPDLDPTQPEASPEQDPVQPEASPADSLNLIPDCGLLMPDSPEPEPAPPKSSSSPDHEQFRLAWNAIAKDCELIECRSISQGRLRSLRERLRDKDWRENYPEALERLRDIKWIRGNAQYKPRGIDWFLQPDTLNKVLEGSHDDNKRDYSIPSPDDSAGLF